jgi:hypothetical protein
MAADRASESDAHNCLNVVLMLQPLFDSMSLIPEEPFCRVPSADEVMLMMSS